MNIANLRGLFDRRSRYERRIDDAMRRITAYLREHPDSAMVEVFRGSDVPAGRGYLALRRLEGAGLVSARWVDRPATRQQLYRLTGGAS